jgi:hypothetical protein
VSAEQPMVMHPCGRREGSQPEGQVREAKWPLAVKYTPVLEGESMGNWNNVEQGGKYTWREMWKYRQN